MHHSLRLYGKHQHRLIHLYIWLAGWSKIPVIGWIVKGVANLWARSGHSGYYLSLSEAEKIVDLSDNIALGPCSCRQEFHNCEHDVMSELVLGKGVKEVYAHRQKEFLSISKEAAKAVLRKAHDAKLTHSIMRCGKNFYAICNCCACCCVPTRLRHDYGIGLALVRNPQVVAEFKRQKLN
jgi:hypothetical protein